jgi:putative sterol carrier protein
MKEIIAKTVIDKINYESTYETMRQAASDSPQQPPQAAEVIPAAPKAESKVIALPQTAREILHSLPQRLKADKLEAGTYGVFHFMMEGEGDFTITLKDGGVTIQESLIGEPTCNVKAKAKDYVDIELGKVNPQMAFMMGKIKISNLAEMMKFMGLFKPVHKLAE